MGMSIVNTSFNDSSSLHHSHPVDSHVASSLANMTTPGGTMFNFSFSEAYDIIISHSWPKKQFLNPVVELSLIVFYGILTATGVIFNGTVCYVMSRPNQRRVPRNLYLVNLAISDLTLSIICMPFTLLIILQRAWTMGIFLCKLLPVVQGTNILVSTATIIVIAVDRYFTIVSPPPNHLSQGGRWCHAFWVCLAVWMVSLVVTIPLAYYQTVEEVALHKIVLWRVCIERWPSQNLRAYYTVIIMVVHYAIPTAVMSFVHFRITRYLRNCDVSKRMGKELVRNQQATVILIMLAAVFAISWLPLHIFSLLADFELFNVDANYLYVIFALCHCLAMTTACSNPIMYGLLNSNFRREAVKILDQKCFSVLSLK